MAEALNVSVQTISAWENEKRRPHPEVPRFLKKIAERNGITWNPRGYPEYVEDGPFIAKGDLPKEISHITCIQDLDRYASNSCGIYFLILEGQVVYVGQSLNSGSRLLEHLREMRRGKRRFAESKKFDRVLFRRCSPSDLDRLERALIRLLRPRFNKIVPKMNQCDDAEAIALISTSNCIENERGYPEYAVSQSKESCH